VLFSLAFVYTNRVIYLGFLINLFFLHVCMCVYRMGEFSGYGLSMGRGRLKVNSVAARYSMFCIVQRLSLPTHPPLLTPYRFSPQYSFVTHPLSLRPPNNFGRMAINNVPNKYILNRNRRDGRLWNLLKFLEVVGAEVRCKNTELWKKVLNVKSKSFNCLRTVSV
jgi:hypothetical protein